MAFTSVAEGLPTEKLKTAVLMVAIKDALELESARSCGAGMNSVDALCDGASAVASSTQTLKLVQHDGSAAREYYYVALVE